MAYACIVCTLLYIFFFQLGLGPIPFFIGSELCSLQHRAAVMSLGSLSSWAGNFTVGISFPILLSFWGAMVFLPFVVICLALIVLIFYYLPETRGKEVSDVVQLISKGFKSKSRPSL
uniref:Major facilitator superfamily (MFS) profile domain-containing protein n=1 Tax=Lutzomyia longipalpis TaxID=7200 RepID=A0A7G3B253_LUTLO